MDVTLIDGHNDLPWAYRELFSLDTERADLAEPQPRLQTDLPRLAAGRVKGQFWSVYVPSTLPEPQAVVATMEQIDLARKIIARYDQLDHATSADEIESVIARGRLASLLGIEGGHSISGSLGVLRQLYRLGARYMTLTHNESTAWADSATDDPVSGGLSGFGREVVAEMNRLGMMVDLSHVADTTMRDALDATAAPVIFSHSNARAVCDVPRNVPDDVLARIPDNGGLVMATFVPFFVSRAGARWMRQALDSARPAEGRIDPYQALCGYARDHEPPAVTIDDVVAQFEHLREVVGVDHVGIGGDFDGSDFVTLGLEDVASYPRLFAALRARGWSAAELDQVAGRNLLRVMRDVESVGQL